MSTELVRWVEPGWELWELGAGRCPYCVGLGPLDFEACCDCWEFERERERERAESERDHVTGESREAAVIRDALERGREFYWQETETWTPALAALDALVAHRDGLEQELAEKKGELAVAYGRGSSTQEQEWFSTLDRANERVAELERERDEARQWGERQADLLTECATACDEAEARVAELERERDALTNERKRMYELWQMEPDGLRSRITELDAMLKVSEEHIQAWEERADAAEARVAVLERERDEAPSVHCVAYDSRGKAMDTVKLLGDREAVLAVKKLKTDKEAAEARVAALTEALREIAAIYKWFAADRYTDAGLRVGRVLTIAREALAAAGEPEAATP